MNRQNKQEEALKTVETALIEARATLQELNDLGCVPFAWRGALNDERHRITEALKATRLLKRREGVR